MSILRLKPACKDYLWGGDRLKEEYGIEYDGEPLAEAWVLSCHPDGPSLIDSGKYRGKTLSEYIGIKGKEIIGKDADKFPDFPVLIKLIDARADLSIQVHPDNEYALSHEGQNGKTEMWYILDALDGAFIYYGFKKEISKEEFAERIRDNTIIEVLNRVPVKKGDVFFLRPGTLHAIGAGCLIAEVQQNSNVTYRIYDYDRKGPDGKKRELHVDKALDVTDRRPPEPYDVREDGLISCEYFSTGTLKIREGVPMKLNISGDSFRHLLVISGNCSVASGEEEFSLKKGDSVFITAGTGEAVIAGDGEIISTEI